jgi:hypothetical protein
MTLPFALGGTNDAVRFGGTAMPLGGTGQVPFDW